MLKRAEIETALNEVETALRDFSCSAFSKQNGKRVRHALKEALLNHQELLASICTDLLGQSIAQAEEALIPFIADAKERRFVIVRHVDRVKLWQARHDRARLRNMERSQAIPALAVDTFKEFLATFNPSHQ